ncbi:MAG: hypothetical protein QX190_03230 [Methylococcales bacterium]
MTTLVFGKKISVTADGLPTATGAVVTTGGFLVATGVTVTTGGLSTATGVAAITAGLSIATGAVAVATTGGLLVATGATTGTGVLYVEGGSISTVYSRYKLPFGQLTSTNKFKKGSFRASFELTLIVTVPFALTSVLKLIFDKK